MTTNCEFTLLSNTDEMPSSSFGEPQKFEGISSIGNVTPANFVKSILEIDNIMAKEEIPNLMPENIKSAEKDVWSLLSAESKKFIVKWNGLSEEVKNDVVFSLTSEQFKTLGQAPTNLLRAGNTIMELPNTFWEQREETQCVRPSPREAYAATSFSLL